MINVYGMRSKAEFPEVYMDFIRREGAPTALRRDNAKEEKSYKVIGINQTYVIEDQFSQPYNQQQNPVERHAIRWLKDHAKILMDRTGAPPDVWLQALMCLADIRNVTSHDSLRGKTPIAERHGDTPDISAFLQFRFWERVYFRQETNFPNTNERAGHFLGIANNTGDAMTFRVLDTDTGDILAVTELRSVRDRFNPNERIRFGERIPPETLHVDDDDAKTDVILPPMHAREDDIDIGIDPSRQEQPPSMLFSSGCVVFFFPQHSLFLSS